MELLYTDYIKLVIAAYKKKQKGSELSPLLPTFTRASIRQECLNVYTERLKKGEREETNTLKAFFGTPQAGKDFSSLIERSDLDKFRPLENLMRNKIKNPVLANVELLAWLIDFRHRPYATGMDVLLNEAEAAVLNNVINNPDNLPGSKKREEEPKDKKGDSSLENEKANHEKSKLKPAIAILLITITFLGGIYIIWQRERSGPLTLGNVNTGCMYWAGDSYAEMPCNEERSGRLKLPMDPEKMKNFKRITREDTITEKSIGRIYYIRIDGRIEYYTTGGNHPVDVTRTLKVLSSYMFFKHLGKQEIAKKELASGETPKFINNR